MLAPSHCSTCPREASPGFLIWPLIHFYRLRFCSCPPRVYLPSPVYVWRLFGGVNGDLHQEDLCHTHVCSTKHIQVCRTQSPCACSVTDSMGMSLSKQWELVMDTEALACCSPWGHKELDTTEQLNELN